MGIHTSINALLQETEICESIFYGSDIHKNILIIDVLTLVYDLMNETIMEKAKNPVYMASFLSNYMIASFPLALWPKFLRIYLTTEGAGHRMKYKSYREYGHKIHINKNLAAYNVDVARYLRDYLYASKKLDPAVNQIYVVQSQTEADVQIACILEMYYLQAESKLVSGQINITAERKQNAVMSIDPHTTMNNFICGTVVASDASSIKNQEFKLQHSRTVIKPEECTNTAKFYDIFIKGSSPKAISKRNQLTAFGLRTHAHMKDKICNSSSRSNNIIKRDDSTDVNRHDTNTRIVIWTSDSDILITAGSLNCQHVQIIWLRKLKLYSLSSINWQIAILLILFGCDRMKRKAPPNTTIDFKAYSNTLTYDDYRLPQKNIIPSTQKITQQLQRWQFDISCAAEIRKVLKYYTHGNLLHLQ